MPGPIIVQPFGTNTSDGIVKVVIYASGGVLVNPLSNPMTTAGDLIYGGTSGTPLRLPIGSTSQVLTVTAGVPTWSTPSTGFTNTAVNNELIKSNGVNGVPSGLFSTTLGNLTLGTGTTGATRNIFADGSATNVGILIQSKGSGSVSLGTTTSPSQIVITNGVVDVTTSLGIGTSTPVRAFHISFNDISTNAVSYLQRLTHTVTGSPLIGIGTGIEFDTQTGSFGTNKVGATIETAATNVTGGTEAFDILFKTMSAGSTATEKLRVSSLGLITIGNSSMSGSERTLQVSGSPSNVSLTLTAKGSGAIYANSLSGDVTLNLGNPSNGSINRILGVAGSSTDINLNILSQGAGSILINGAVGSTNSNVEVKSTNVKIGAVYQIEIINTSHVPGSNPVGGIYTYVESGVWKWRDPSGNIYPLNITANLAQGSTNELQKNGGAGAFSGTGLFSAANGDQTFGTGIAGSVRQLTADGSATDVSLRLTSKGAGSIQLQSNGEIILGSNSSVNTSLVVQAASYGSGLGVVFLRDANTVPSGNPTSGLLFYSESGILKYRSSAGNIYPLIASGSSGQIQYNGGTNQFNASANFTWDNSNTRLTLGTGTLVVADASIGRLKAAFTTSDNSIFHIAGYFQADQTVSGSNSIQGLEGYTRAVHPSGTLTLAIGTIGNIELASTGTLSIARSLQASGNTSAAGTITEWDGVYVAFANTASATITSAYGFYLDTFPSGVTNKYGIAIAETTAKSGFGLITPTAMVDIIGSTTSISSLRIRSGTAPSSPNDGDMWYDGTNVKFRVGGTTKTFTLT